jgi:hypothetical protein
MSSSLRGILASPDGNTDLQPKFVNLTTVSYYDEGLNAYIPVPFVIDRDGKLDVNVQDGFTTSEDIFEQFAYNKVRKMGGSRPVVSLGTKLRTYLTNVLETTLEDTVTNIQIQTPGLMTKVQYVKPSTGAAIDENQMMNQFYPWGITDVAPASDDYIFQGSNADNWSTYWVFQKPITLSFKVNGTTTKYLTLWSDFEQNYPLID